MSKPAQLTQGRNPLKKAVSVFKDMKAKHSEASNLIEITELLSDVAVIKTQDCKAGSLNHFAHDLSVNRTVSH